MTREEARSYIIRHCNPDYPQGKTECERAVNMAIKALEEPQWIPWNSGKLPEESGTYTVTAYDGVARRVTHAKYLKRLKRWELTEARAYWRVLAWKPMPESWEGDAE